MRQTLVLVRLDWRRLQGERSPWVLVGVLSAGLVLAAIAGTSRANEAWASVTRGAERERALRLGVVETSTADVSAPRWGPAHPDFVANDRGTLAIARPAPLAALSLGHAAVYPAAVKVTAEGRSVGTAPADLAHPLAERLGAFDVEFIVVFLWPLAILVLTSDAIAKDRERGPLTLLLAQPVPAATLVLAWTLSRGALLLGPVLVVSWIVAAAGPEGTVSAAAVWSVITVAYGLFWIAAALAVAAWGRTAAITTTALGVLWLAVVLVAPGAARLAASTFSPVPSDVAFTDATRTATREALTDGSRVLGHFLEDHPTASAVGRDGLRQYALLQAARDQEVSRRLGPVRRDFEQAVERQRSIVQAVTPLTPAMLASALLQLAAGTSPWHGRDFLDQVEAFRAEWGTYFGPRILAGGPLTADDTATMPTFSHRPIGALAMIRKCATGVVWLLLLSAGLSWLATARLQRHPLGAVPS